MASTTINNFQNHFQDSRWKQALVLLIFILLTYVAPVLANINQGRPDDLKQVILSLGLVASLAIAAILFILRFIYGERFNDLNLKQGRWWQDVLGGIALAGLTLGTLFLLGRVINQVLPRAPNSGWGDILPGVEQEPWLLVLFLGPTLAISVGWEEISRVFLLSRWWKIASGTAWRWLGVLISAALWGLAHFYQGPSGMANVAINGIILAVAYLRFGRVLPLIICHYLHASLQIVQFVYLLRNSLMWCNS